jgi:hypothetical protein
VATFTLEPAPETVTRAPHRVTAPRSEADVVEAIRAELATYLHDMSAFTGSEPDLVLQRLSAISARATEIRIHLSRSDSRLASKIRVSEIEPLIEECDRQFRIFSRLFSMREFDLKLSGGQI